MSPFSPLLLLPLLFTTVPAQYIYISDLNCPSYNCGNVTIRYPFWRIDGESTNQFCGYQGLGINCLYSGGRNISEISLGGDPYYFQGINYTLGTFSLADYDVSPAARVTNNCPRVRHNINLGTLNLNFSINNVNLSFHFDCNGCPAFATEIPCLERNGTKACLDVLNNSRSESVWDEYSCDQEVVTTVSSGGVNSIASLPTEFGRVLRGGFELRWWVTEDCSRCELSGGRCGYSNTTGFICFCADGTSSKRYCKGSRPTNFILKLGQGGFGQVFKGKLSDGQLVAVKVLTSSKANGQEFINEVASIGRTSHVNIVTLLGFCFDYKKRALVYEYMPNGSLEKYIHSQIHMETSEHLRIQNLYEIALGIACGLDYLHRGCNTRILHLDIKPHNMLLDEDFCPKIADFDLAKLYSRKKSTVSMLEARGTIGYIAPEVYNNNFGGVSHKSDVYSYGVLLLEMVGGRKNIDAGVGSGRSSEIYFPDWIYKRLHKDDFLLDTVKTAEENDQARKMTIVGLWCIQPDPNQRPSIDKVIEMLEGSMESLVVPPKPFFSSPPRSPATIYSASDSII